MDKFSCITRLFPTGTSDCGRIFGFRICRPSGSSIGSCRGVKSSSTLEEEPLPEENNTLEEDNVQKLRDISRLKPWHRNIANRIVPSEEKTQPFHFTTLYNKRLFGRYGYASGVNPSVCWPTKAQLDDKKEYERVAYPYSILEVAEREKLKNEEKECELFERDAKVAANVKSMQKLKEEYLKKKEIKRQEAEAAKAFRTRLIEEVRLHFNYTVNEREEQFKLEVKERAKQLKEKEKKDRKLNKKEKQALEKAAKFEREKEKLREAEEAKKLAEQSLKDD
ncbi:Growth arrest and DNA damage-inducible proteins-interacting protein 1 [Frankliniella fusca]|uniref:Large ribosomal subunit protein mL64 n=1 Tax=Frankliniella fusca TaxID=407009 RepID=A0AAE1HEN5_9NEOP|nr:Growth arrest and DNA damage-inducible proteins-interacting protein 1 [Frankliniella fusca]KAK3924736.1 Growth arrest and DNA damage-inducible proteins-interacting protein 1 [Frankliniella fusca]